MEIDIAKQIGAVAREVASRDYEGKPARVVVASQTYSTTAEDLFEAITTTCASAGVTSCKATPAARS